MQHGHVSEKLHFERLTPPQGSGAGYTNENFRIIAGSLICIYLSIPDWLKLRKGKIYNTAASHKNNNYHRNVGREFYCL